jgi:hypothetical protein
LDSLKKWGVDTLQLLIRFLFVIQIKEDIVSAAESDQVRRSTRFGNTRLFSRWFAELRGGKHVVVVVVSHYGSSRRHWIITAYIARKLAGEEIEWKKN